MIIPFNQPCCWLISLLAGASAWGAAVVRDWSFDRTADGIAVCDGQAVLEELVPDFLHPKDYGYKLWADALQPYLDRIFPKMTISPSKNRGAPEKLQ